MKARILLTSLAVALAAPLVVGAQPTPRQGAGFLLARTGELQLTDQQVTRLAAIARREETQRKAMRASLDSLRTARLAQRAATPDSARRAGPPRRGFAGPPNGAAGMAPGARPLLDAGTMTRARDQQRANLRDAIAVLTPDQQATAWTMISQRGAGRGMGVRAMRGGARGMQPGAPRGMGPGAALRGQRGPAGAPGAPRGPGRVPRGPGEIDSTDVR